MRLRNPKLSVAYTSAPQPGFKLDSDWRQLTLLRSQPTPTKVILHWFRVFDQTHWRSFLVGNVKPKKRITAHDNRAAAKILGRLKPAAPTYVPSSEGW